MYVQKCVQPTIASRQAGPSSTSAGRLLYVRDRKHSIRFLVDTGAAVSVLPPRSVPASLCFSSPYSPRSPRLQAANHSQISTFGQRLLDVDLGLRRQFKWVFVIADVRFPILGADFLSHFNLAVDVAQRQLVDTTTNFRATGPASDVSNSFSNLLTSDCPDSYSSLLAEFPELVRPNNTESPVKHNVTHRIVTTGHPVHARPRRLAPDRLAAAKGEFQHMLDLGIVRLSSSCWASPLHLVAKKSGNWRPCRGGSRGGSGGSIEPPKFFQVRFCMCTISMHFCIFAVVDLP